MHRIDRETAGLVLFTIQADTRGKYQSLFEHREVHKTYHAIAPNLSNLQLPFVYTSRIVESDAFMQMCEVNVGSGHPANAETKIELLETKGPFARWVRQF